MTPLLAFALAQAAATPAPAQAPFPRDGFTYPGDRGTEAATARYQARWERHVAALPKAPEGIAPPLRDFAWMVGRWTAVVRDYEDDAAKGRGILDLARGTAEIAFVPGGKWLRIETDVPGFYSVRYLGWDRVARRIVLRDVGSPGAEYRQRPVSAGWKGDRAVFGPARLTYYGLELTDRLTFLREAPDRLRIVTEGRLAEGRWVAFDDTVFTRVNGATTP